MRIVEPLSLRIAKTITELLDNSTSSVSMGTLCHRLDASPIDVMHVVDQFSIDGLVRLHDNQLFITEKGLSEVA